MSTRPALVKDDGPGAASPGENEHDELIDRFESCRLGPGGFGHADHVRLVWAYRRRLSPLETLVRVAEGTRRIATAHGDPGKYHETITWAYTFLILERIARTAAATWEDFAGANPDLLDYRGRGLRDYYEPDTLRSPLARAQFVLPDRIGIAERRSG